MVRAMILSIGVGLAMLSAADASEELIASQQQTSTIAGPEVVRRGSPVYPAGVDPATVNGTVRLDALVGVDGTVTDVAVVRSIPALDAAAMDAARQYLFRPARKNGEPVPVVVRLEIAFVAPAAAK